MVQLLYYNYHCHFLSVKIFHCRQIFVRLIFMGSADSRKFITHENFYVYGITYCSECDSYYDSIFLLEKKLQAKLLAINYYMYY